MPDRIPFPLFVALIPLIALAVFLALLAIKVIQTVMEVRLGTKGRHENAPYDPT